MLREALSARPGRDAVVVSPGARWSGGDLIGQLTPEDRSRISGSAVAVQYEQLVDAVRAITALEDLASAIVVLSPAYDRETTAMLAESAGARLILSDREQLPPSLRRLAVGEMDASADGSRSAATSYCLATSGTTGTPKLVKHSFESVARTVRRSGGTAGARWGMLYELSRFAGFQVLLQALVGQGTLLVPRPSMPLADQLDFLAAEGCTHLSATPTMWRKILLTPNGLAPKQITLGGEIADDKILAALAARYATARVTHIFASTEAGVGFSVKDGRAGFPASWLSAPPSGVEIALREGRLFVRNNAVEPAYLGTGSAFADTGGFVDTGDAVEIRGERVLFLGRENGIVNVGGNKVFPEKVERVLNAHPAVRLARVFAKKNPLTGALVAAQVVVNDASAGETIEADLKRWCRDRLERHETPALIQLVADFDTNASGKLARGQAK